MRGPRARWRRRRLRHAFGLVAAAVHPAPVTGRLRRRRCGRRIATRCAAPVAARQTGRGGRRTSAPAWPWVAASPRVVGCAPVLGSVREAPRAPPPWYCCWPPVQRLGAHHHRWSATTSRICSTPRWTAANTASSPAHGGWSEELYTAKLRAVGRALAAADRDGADLVALQEVEHYGAARRLVQLELDGLGYRHVVWLPDPHNANGPVVLSKLPVRRVGRAVGRQRPGLPPPRSAWKAVWRVRCDRFWKWRWRSDRTPTRHRCSCSTITGNRSAEAPPRPRCSGATRRRCWPPGSSEISAADAAAEIVVVGDLNESIDEYERQGRRYATALMPAATHRRTRAAGCASPEPCRGRAGAPLQLFSPWLTHDAGESQPPGSYRFKGDLGDDRPLAARAGFVR